MESVSWEQCQEFLTALNSRLDGIQLSLPSEAQWEYACRAGTETARYSENLDAIAWYDENSGNETHSVAGKEANSWGLYDMLGNVWEWCADVWVNDYTEKARASAAESASAHRVVRGGSWGDGALLVRGVPQPQRALEPEQQPGLPLCRVQARVVSGGSQGSEAEGAEHPGARDPASAAGRKAREAGTGVALAIAPSVIVLVLLGSALDSPAGLLIARVRGAALFSLGAACWLAQVVGQAPGLVQRPGLEAATSCPWLMIPFCNASSPKRRWRSAAARGIYGARRPPRRD